MASGCRARALAAAAAFWLAGAAGAEIRVSDAWVRATVPGQTTSGAFMRITSATNARLVGARTDVAEAVEIHETRHENDTARMRRVMSVPLPAGRAVELKPGGYHLMLLGLKRRLQAGDRVQITLWVDQGSGGQPNAIEVEAAGRALGAGHVH